MLTRIELQGNYERRQCHMCVFSSICLAILRYRIVSAFQLGDNIKITLIGSEKPLPATPSEPAVPRERERKTEENTIAEIHREIETVKSGPAIEVESFLMSLRPHTSASGQLNGDATDASNPQHEKELGKTQMRLSEILLQALLRLDALPSSATWENARKERREGVRVVQGLLDRLDEGWRARTGK